MEERPVGVCPNCWGQQEYQDQVKEAVYKEQIDVNNHQKKRAFIMDFVKTNITGILLKEESGGKICPACNASFNN